jgi:hypothetical protein
MKRNFDYENNNIVDNLSKKLKFDFKFNIEECYISLHIINIGMACNKFFVKTHNRFLDYPQFNIGNKILLQKFFYIYNNNNSNEFNEETQIQLVKSAYNVDSDIISSFTS